jgi:hypothetical protein
VGAEHERKQTFDRLGGHGTGGRVGALGLHYIKRL